MLCMVTMAHATLVTIGTATYNGSNYNLIWDNNNNGNSVVWLDYTHNYTSWQGQKDWATSLDGSLTYNIDNAYTVTWNSSGTWRIGSMVDGVQVYGYEGDPNADGIYSYTYGYNLANSEIGHLFYEELGNWGRVSITGTTPQLSEYGLQNTGDFQHLESALYWSDTAYTNAISNDWAWSFSMVNGMQDRDGMRGGAYGLALRSGQVSVAGDPVPEPATMLLFGTGLAGLIGSRIKRKKSA